jgi:hypothetical protein
MAIFRRWAAEKGLKPSETGYVRHTRGGTVALQFSKSGDPKIEKSYSTHYVSPALGERKLQKLQEKLERAPQPVVFQILRDSECSECGAEIEPGSLLSKEGEQALCLSCSHFEDLEYLPSGDTALTRRASKYRAARVRAAERRRKQDRELVVRMVKEIGNLFPGCPLREVIAIAEHTAVRGSGRVGRSEAGWNLGERALTLAVVAAVRHNHTEYDRLLASGVDREAARKRITGEVEEILAAWRKCFR